MAGTESPDPQEAGIGAQASEEGTKQILVCHASVLIFRIVKDVTNHEQKVGLRKAQMGSSRIKPPLRCSLYSVDLAVCYTFSLVSKWRLFRTVMGWCFLRSLIGPHDCPFFWPFLFPASFAPFPVLFMAAIVLENPFRHHQISIVGGVQPSLAAGCPARNVDLRKTDAIRIAHAVPKRAVRKKPAGLLIRITSAFGPDALLEPFHIRTTQSKVN
jgi:hypothetical protein